MERQIQKPGVRKWYADDLLKLQDQLYKSIEDGILQSLNANVIIGGINIINNTGGEYDITPGLAYINGKICYFDGVIDTDIPQDAAIVLQDEETANKEYADGQTKPTEHHYKAILGDINANNYIPIAINSDNKSRLILPYFDDNGNILNLPKSDTYTNSDTNILATLKAVNELYNFLHKKYIKENFNNGEIDQSTIPAGYTALGKDSGVLIDEGGKIYAAALDIEDTINALAINVTNLLATSDIIANGDIIAEKIISNTYVESDNTPKMLISVDGATGNVLSSKGSVLLDNEVGKGGTGLYYISVSVPVGAIMVASVNGGVQNIAIHRDTATGYPTIEIKDNNNNYVDANFSASIYY